VRYYDDHPFGLGVYTFPDTLTADAVRGLTYELDEITTVTFVKHNEAKNMRLTSFGRETWILYLGFPLDYQTTEYIQNAVKNFGLLTIWQNPRGNKKFVLVKAWIVDPKFVPKSLVMHQLGGASELQGGHHLQRRCQQARGPRRLRRESEHHPLSHSSRY
jgi:hypothetical protein